jgi:hypothetical protein
MACAFATKAAKNHVEIDGSASAPVIEAPSSNSESDIAIQVPAREIRANG